MPIPRRRRRRAIDPSIDPSFARTLAGQVAAGLARTAVDPDPSHEQRHVVTADECQRARTALIAIGIMLIEATPGDELVENVLALAETSYVTRS